MGLADNALVRKGVKQRFHAILTTLFDSGDDCRIRVRQAQQILLYFAKLPRNLNNYRLAAEFFLDNGYVMRYNKGYRYYKGISAALTSAQVKAIVEKQNID